MFKQYFLFSAVITSLLLSACSSKLQLHLFSAYLDQIQVNHLVDNIDKNTFDVHIHNVPFPESINENTLIYSPFIKEVDKVDLLVKNLQGLDYFISSIELIKLDNHKFTGNNIGLYLLPEGYIQHQTPYVINVTNEYGGKNCLYSSNLTLNDDASFTLEVSAWMKEIEDYKTSFINGTWLQQNNENIVLNSGEWELPLVFNRRFLVEKTQNGTFQTVELTPVTEVNEVNEPFQQSINCTYSISMAMGET